MTSDGQSPYWLPRFIAVGPPRTGTTWVHSVLAGHVNLPRYHKETRFFDFNYEKGLDWYAGNFDPALASLPAGEICPTYFHSQQAPGRIAQLVPCARIICSLRDPLERMFSLYKTKRAHGCEARTFEAALQTDPELIESGRYCFHLMRWRSMFGSDRVLTLVYEDLVRDPQAYLDTICTFVGIAPIVLTADQRRRVNSSAELTSPKNPGWTRVGAITAEWLKTRGWGTWVAAAKKSAPGRLFLGGGQEIPAPDAQTEARVRRLLRPDVERLEEILTRDLSLWK
jgi:Sulfotransferase domain